MKLVLALVAAAALLAPIKANADKGVNLYWVTYYPGYSTTLVSGPYATWDECAAHARGYQNTGSYICL